MTYLVPAQLALAADFTRTSHCSALRTNSIIGMKYERYDTIRTEVMQGKNARPEVRLDILCRLM